MKKYDDDMMNYDENGNYPDERHVSPQVIKAVDIICAVLGGLILIGAVLYVLIFITVKEYNKTTPYVFFSSVFVVGILALFNYTFRGNRPPTSTYVMLCMGIIGIPSTHIFMTGSDNTRFFMVKLLVYSSTLAVAAAKATSLVKRIRYNNICKSACTQSVQAKCVYVTISKRTLNEQTYNIGYRPTYEYTVDYKTYKKKSVKIRPERIFGATYTIFVDPADPSRIYDPDSKEEKLPVLIVKIVITGVLAIVMSVLYVYIFKRIGI